MACFSRDCFDVYCERLKLSGFSTSQEIGQTKPCKVSQENKTPNPSRADRADEFALLFGSHARQIYSYILTLIPNFAAAQDWRIPGGNDFLGILRR